MLHTGTDIQKLVNLLGGWPPHFDDVEKAHGESLLRYLKRDGLIDEPVFGQVVRYAIHRAAFDRLSVMIVDEGFDACEGNFMSGLSQQRAAHENRLAVLERDLLGTPYVRAKQGQSTQTSFMGLLDEPTSEEATSGGKVITPFRPLTRKRGPS
ncbi:MULTISPECIES: hypothetical protein [Phaeobacter]|uniref:hypothetical protein n=1 Tax=Phaeobacter TaxID=302485 RepID=UPI00058F5E2A|nr:MULTISPECIES: hypothetical protein [Phaeobacter]KII11288.1 hypothetical protein OO25_21960 [Phaeobacter sp. S60]MDO6755388.1 hypothetical protein [Phaeobacter inhibens]